MAQRVDFGRQPATVNALVSEVLNLGVAHVVRVIAFGAAVLADMARDRPEGTAQVSRGRRGGPTRRTDSQLQLALRHGFL